MIGTKVSHYDILEKVGHGGMGEVYRAEDTHLRRPVALKFLSTSLEGSRASRDQFFREARAAASLDHPNICPIYDIAETPAGHVYIVMAFCDGATLSERLSRGRLPLAETIEIGSQVAAGLGAAHAHGIVHRDLKPQNVIIGTFGGVRIVDFGLATLLDEKKEPFSSAGERSADYSSPDLVEGEELAGTRPAGYGRPCGTFHYMSPEQITGDAIGPPSDVFSLGILLYEMIAGAPPFYGETPDLVVRKIQKYTPPNLARVRPEVPREWSDLVDKALAKSPQARFADGTEVHAALRQVKRVGTSG